MARPLSKRNFPHVGTTVFCLPIILATLSLFTSPKIATSQASSRQEPVVVRFDYAGAEALLDAAERNFLSDEDVAKLLEIHGVAAMVDNVTHYQPVYGREQFQSELKDFVQNHKSAGSPFALDQVFRTREQVRSLIRDLKANESAIVRGMLQELAVHRPPTGAITATVYFVVGGSSDGFVLDHDDESAFFVALDKAHGDLDGVRFNMTHELYHVMQKAAARRVPNLQATISNPALLAPPESLLATTLWEGTANHAVDALKAKGTGPYMEAWRNRYERNLEPARVKENFALFDTLLADLRAGRTTWAEAYKIGFSGDAKIYFVGYKMAKAIERYDGARRIGDFFVRPPAEFFQEYINLCHRHPDIVDRFSPASEAYFAKHE